MSKRSTAGLIKYVKFLMDAGAMQRPVWLEAVERVPPPPLPKHGRKPPAIAFPEDDLIRNYYKRNPEAVLEPLDLTSFEPPTAKRFALRQLDYMQQGLTRKEARAKVAEEFAEEVEARRLEGKAPDTIIEQIQAEEETHLKEALKTYVANHGHKPMSFLQKKTQRPQNPQNYQSNYQTQQARGQGPQGQWQQRGQYQQRGPPGTGGNYTRPGQGGRGPPPAEGQGAAQQGDEQTQQPPRQQE